jgi:hypothetical protein
MASALGGSRALVAAVVIVLVAQAATVYVVHRMVTPTGGASAGVAERPRAAAVPAQRFVSGDVLRPGLRAPGAAEGEPLAAASRGPVAASKPAQIRQPWSSRPLDEAGQRLADAIHWSADDLRLLADLQGRIPERTRRDLVAAHDLGKRIADDLGLAGNGRDDELARVVVGYMVRRVTMRESFRHTSVTPEAIDEAARIDALAQAESVDERAKDAVASALPGLPDLTADLPR